MRPQVCNRLLIEVRRGRRVVYIRYRSSGSSRGEVEVVELILDPEMGFSRSTSIRYTVRMGIPGHIGFGQNGAVTSTARLEQTSLSPKAHALYGAQPIPRRDRNLGAFEETSRSIPATRETPGCSMASTRVRVRAVFAI